MCKKAVEAVKGTIGGNSEEVEVGDRQCLKIKWLQYAKFENVRGTA